MFDNITKFFRKLKKSEKEESKIAAKERLHLVLAQDRANISADFLEMMKQEIIEVIKKYIDIDEKAIDVRLTNKESEDGVIGAPSLYANIPIITIKNEARQLEGSLKEKKEKEEAIEKQNDLDIQDENKENQNTENLDKTEEADNDIKVDDESEEKVDNITENVEDNNNTVQEENNDNKEVEEEKSVDEPKTDSKPDNVHEEPNKAKTKKTSKTKQKKNNKNKVNEVKDEKKDS